MAEWTVIVNSTIHKYIKGKEQLILRNRKLTALMESKGRIEMNYSGDMVDWKVQHKLTPMRGFSAGDTLTFPVNDYLKTAQLEPRGYALTGGQLEFHRLKNKGVEAIVNIFSDETDIMLESAEEQFGEELYVDGNASGNEKRMHGIESFMGTSGAGAKSPIGLPSDTYATIVTTLGNYGGTWSVTGTNTNVDWPAGTGDTHYDFWTPLVVDYTSANVSSAATGITGWQSTTATWASRCREAIRYGILHGRKNKSKDGMLDLILLHPEMYRLFEEKVEASERLNIKRGEGSALYTLGFGDVINYDGVDISSEYGITQNRGYGFTTAKMKLCSWQSSLWEPRGPDYDIASHSYRFLLTCFGNLKFTPRYFVKWLNVT